MSVVNLENRLTTTQQITGGGVEDGAEVVVTLSLGFQPLTGKALTVAIAARPESTAKEENRILIGYEKKIEETS